MSAVMKKNGMKFFIHTVTPVPRTLPTVNCCAIAKPFPPWVSTRMSSLDARLRSQGHGRLAFARSADVPRLSHPRAAGCVHRDRIGRERLSGHRA